jgi:hypothetical protein
MNWGARVLRGEGPMDEETPDPDGREDDERLAEGRMAVGRVPSRCAVTKCTRVLLNM